MIPEVQINTQVNELLHGASMIQLYGQEERVIEEFDQTTEKMTVANDRLVLADSIASWTLTEFLKYIVIAGIFNHCRPILSWGRFGDDCRFLVYQSQLCHSAF